MYFYKYFLKSNKLSYKLSYKKVMNYSQNIGGYNKMKEVNKIISGEINRGKDKAKDIKLMCLDLQVIKNISENNAKTNEDIFLECICNAYYLGLERGFTRTNRMDRYITNKEEFEACLKKQMYIGRVNGMFKDENEAIKKYNKVFEDGFPSIPLLNRPEKEIIEIVETCIKENKDVYEMGYLKLDNDIMY